MLNVSMIFTLRDHVSVIFFMLGSQVWGESERKALTEFPEPLGLKHGQCHDAQENRDSNQEADLQQVGLRFFTDRFWWKRRKQDGRLGGSPAQITLTLIPLVCHHFYNKSYIEPTIQRVPFHMVIVIGSWERHVT